MSGNSGPFNIPSALRESQAATIPSGSSLSNAIDLLSTVFLGFIAPAAWDAAALQIEVSDDNVNWVTTLNDKSGAVVGSYSSFNVGEGYAVDVVSLLPFRYIRFLSGTPGTPINQTADRVFKVLTRPYSN